MGGGIVPNGEGEERVAVFAVVPPKEGDAVGRVEVVLENVGVNILAPVPGRLDEVEKDGKKVEGALLVVAVVAPNGLGVVLLKLGDVKEMLGAVPKGEGLGVVVAPDVKENGVLLGALGNPKPVGAAGLAAVGAAVLEENAEPVVPPKANGDDVPGAGVVPPKLNALDVDGAPKGVVLDGAVVPKVVPVDGVVPNGLGAVLTPNGLGVVLAPKTELVVALVEGAPKAKPGAVVPKVVPVDGVVPNGLGVVLTPNGLGVVLVVVVGGAPKGFAVGAGVPNVLDMVPKAPVVGFFLV